MVRITLALLFATSTSLLVGVSEAEARCNQEKMTKTLTKLMESRAPGLAFMRSYRLDGRGGDDLVIGRTEILSRGETYRIDLATTKKMKAKGLKVFLVSQTSGRTVATSFERGTYKKALEYEVTATGRYLLRFQFDRKARKSGYCGAAVLSRRITR